MMQFDWTTFVLEVLNFLVLVWILHRLFYRPILAMLDARQQRIKDDIAHAELLNSQGEELCRQYELRLQEWTQERENLRRETETELAQIRSAALEKLKQTLADEEAKLQVRNQALNLAREAAQRRKACDVAYQQVTTLLQRLTSPQLTNSIVTLLLEDLATLSQAEQSSLRKAAQSSVSAADLKIISAHKLDEGARLALSQGLTLAGGQALQFAFKEQPALIAGLRVVIGECQMDANLAAELAFFRRQVNDD